MQIQIFEKKYVILLLFFETLIHESKRRRSNFKRNGKGYLKDQLILYQKV